MKVLVYYNKFYFYTIILVHVKQHTNDVRRSPNNATHNNLSINADSTQVEQLHVVAIITYRC